MAIESKKKSVCFMASPTRLWEIPNTKPEDNWTEMVLSLHSLFILAIILLPLIRGLERLTHWMTFFHVDLTMY